MSLGNLRLAGAAAITAVVLATATAGAWDEGVVVSSDFNSSGAIGSFSRWTPWTVTPDRETIHPDAVARWHDGLVYVVNRAGANNVQVLDPAAGYHTVDQFSLGTDRNLQDIVFDGQGEAYVSCYDRPVLLRIDPTTGEVLDVISTASFADADGLPETGRMVVVGQRLFLNCERLDRLHGYVPVGDSYLLVYDMASEAWVDAAPSVPGINGIRLAGTDPYGEPRRDGGRILVPCIGNYAQADAGVDVVDAAALVSLGFEITGAQVGGDIVDLDLGPDGRRHVIVSDAAFHTSVRRYDPANGQVAILAQSSGYNYADIAWDGDLQLFLADRTLLAAGVRVYDARSGVQLTTGPLATGLPPASFALPVGAAVGVPAVLPASSLMLSAPWPNPANPLTTVRYSAPPGAEIALRVVDLRGRVVRAVRILAGGAGTGIWAFDGLDDAGRPAASGVYRVVGETTGGFAVRPLTLVR